MLITDTHRLIATKLSFDFQIHLLRVRILHIAFHGREVEKDSGWQSQSVKDVRKDGRPGLGWGKTDADLTEVRDIGRVSCR